MSGVGIGPSHRSERANSSRRTRTVSALAKVTGDRLSVEAMFDRHTTAFAKGQRRLIRVNF